MVMTDDVRETLVSEVEALGLESPEQVADMVLDAAEVGGIEAGREQIAQCILSDLKSLNLASPSALQNMASESDDPLICSKGAGSVHALRRVGNGWRYIGFAVWSCKTQGWVCGSWRAPVSLSEAHEYLADMAWEG